MERGRWQPDQRPHHPVFRQRVLLHGAGLRRELRLRLPIQRSIDRRGAGGGGSAAPTAQITATMQSSNTALVTWYTTNAVSASINGTPLNAASGSASVQVNDTTTFTLVVTGATGAVATHSATVTLSAPGSGPTAQITATLGANNYVTVSWQTTNATSSWITANGAYYAVGPSGSAGITVTEPTTFTLTAQAPDGRRATSVATVGSAPPGNSSPTAQITATLGANNYVTVSWQTANATSTWITANGAYYAVGPSGSAGITVSGQTTFTLHAQAADGRTATSVATVGATRRGGRHRRRKSRRRSGPTTTRRSRGAPPTRRPPGSPPTAPTTRSARRAAPGLP